MIATSVGFVNGSIVGGRPIDATVTPTEARTRREGVSEDFGGAASGQ